VSEIDSQIDEPYRIAPCQLCRGCRVAMSIRGIVMREPSTVTSLHL
jgi:hypothetical protein